MYAVKQFKVSAAGEMRWGIIYIPDSGAKAPLVAFFHGIGESGSTQGDTQRLLAHGPLKFYKDGWRPNYIILALQEPGSASPDIRKVKYVMDNDPEIQRAWNGQVLWTGLSFGGAQVEAGMAFKMEGKFVPMSPMSQSPKDIDMTIDWRNRVWIFHGTGDGNAQTPFTGSQFLAESMNQKQPGAVRLTAYEGGHGGWNTFYDPKYKEEGKNIYEWAFGSEVATPLPPVEQPVDVPAKQVKQTIILYTDGTFESK